jgi:hypothetical protein
MKVLTIAIITLVVSTAFLACKKDSSKPSTSPAIAGVYDGKYGFDTETPGNDYTLNVRADGVIQEIGQSSGHATGQGTWQLNGNTLTATYKMLFSPYNQYSIVATFDAATGKLTGTWGYDNNGTDGGKIDMKKN